MLAEDGSADFAAIRLARGGLLAGLALDLEDLVGRRVNIVTEAGLHWFIRDRVLREAQAVTTLIDGRANDAPPGIRPAASTSPVG